MIVNANTYSINRLVGARNIHPVNRDAVKEMVELLKLKGYSNNTIKTYQNEFAQFLTALRNNPVDNCDAQKVRSYMLYCYDQQYAGIY